MKKDTRILLGVACAIVGAALTYKCMSEPKPSKAEIEATRGEAGICLSIPGLALVGLGAYLVFKKD